MKKISAISILLGLMLFWQMPSSTLAQGGGKATLNKIPGSIPKSARADMENARQKVLDSEKENANAVKIFNSECAGQKPDSPQYGGCLAEAKRILQQQKEIEQAVRDFNARLAKVIEVQFHSILNDKKRRGEPLDAPRTNRQGNRSAHEYAMVIKQFGIHKVGNPGVADEEIPARYQRDELTYCNIFVWDVTRAMGAEIPHWVGSREMTANLLADWLEENGRNQGWHLIRAKHSPEEAEKYIQGKANAGHPTIAIRKKEVGPGHIAIVRPGSEGFADGVAIAQAGGMVTNADHFNQAFGGDDKDVDYWWHE